MQQLRQPRRNVMSPLFYLAFLIAAASNANAETVIDFDDAPIGLTPGNTYANQGITLASGSIQDAIATDDILTFSDRNDQFYVLDVNAISMPNLAVAADFESLGNSSLQDILITLASPALIVSVDLDNALLGDPGMDLVRLIALEATATPDQFKVVSFVESFDNPVLPATMTLSASEPFSFAIFQITTELEGLDNLRVTFVPEPSSLVLIAVGGVGLVASVIHRRRGQRVARVRHDAQAN